VRCRVRCRRHGCTLGSCVGEWGLEELADDVELIVSELVTNGYQAAGGSPTVGGKDDGYQGRLQRGCGSNPTGVVSLFSCGMEVIRCPSGRSRNRIGSAGADCCWWRP